MQSTATALMLVGVMVMGVSPARGNMLSNPGFEKGMDYWEFAGTGAAVTRESGARKGSGCVAVQGGKDYGLIYQWAGDAVPGARYEASFHARSASGSTNTFIKIEFMDENGEKIQQGFVFKVGGKWETFKFSRMAPETARRVALTLGANAGTTVLYDDASLTGKRVKLKTGMEFDFERLGQRVQGFGVHIWSSNLKAAAEFKNLNITHVRLTQDWDSWDQMKKFRRVTDDLGVKWLYCKWIFEKEYGGEDKKLKDVPGYANGWVKTVQELDRNGCRPHFIDLMNEPDYFGIPADKYNRLVKLVRKGLDRAGFKDVGIVGPGLTHVGVTWSHVRYLNALDDDAVKSLVAWATHGWEDVWSDMSGSVSITDARAKIFVESSRERDPDKPRWYTEYATRQIRFHGIKYPHPDYESDDYNASYTQAYAMRVFENTISLLNHGVNVPFYWCAQDHAGSKKQWGYIGPNGEKKAIYYALKALYGNMPLGARVVLPPAGMDRHSVYAGVYLHTGGSGGPTALVVAVNTSAENRTATIKFKNAPVGLKVAKAELCEVEKWGSLETKTGDAAKLTPKKIRLRKKRGGYEMKVSLPRDSALAVVLR